MVKLYLLMCIVLVSCTMCKKRVDNNDAVDFSLLNSGDFILKVDRVSKTPKVQFPQDSLNESYYTSTDEDIQYKVTFTEDGRVILLKPEPVRGERAKESKTYRYYDLVDGLFAGGRFIIWINNSKFEAEYTIFGSGIPIVKSERGTLEPLNMVK